MENSKTILVADSDTAFYEQFKAIAEVQHLKFHFVEDAQGAETLIRAQAQGQGDPLLAVLVSSNLLAHYGCQIIQSALAHLPSIPLVLIEDMKTGLDKNLDYQKLGISRQLVKPFGVKEIKDIVGSRLQSVYSGEEIWAEKELFVEGKSDYHPIRIDLFVPGNKSLFDLYIKLAGDKFLKLFRVGDKLELERLSNYAHKDLKYLYILKGDRQKYIEYCKIITPNILNKEHVGVQKKFGLLFNQVEATTQTLYGLGVDNHSLVHAQKNVKEVFHLVVENAQKDDFLKSLIREAGQFQHSTSVLAVASVMAKQMGLESQKSIEILGVAALFHDVGLIREVDQNNMYDSVDESQRYLNEEILLDRLNGKKIFGDEKNQLENIYRNHPQKGAEIIAKMPSIPAVVPQIIRQHHAIENKVQGKMSGKIHPLAEVIEISDIFVHTIKRFQGQSVDRTYLLKAFLDITKRFPQRTREPFQAAFNITKQER